MPGADIPAFGPTHAQGIINSCDTIFLFVGCTKGAHIGTRRILTMHATTRDEYFVVFTLVHDIGSLESQPIVWSQTIIHITFVRPILRLGSFGRNHLRKRFLRLRKLGRIGLTTSAHALATTNALGQIKQGRQFTIRGFRHPLLGSNGTTGDKYSCPPHTECLQKTTPTDCGHFAIFLHNNRVLPVKGLRRTMMVHCLFNIPYRGIIQIVKTGVFLNSMISLFRYHIMPCNDVKQTPFTLFVTISRKCNQRDI